MSMSMTAGALVDKPHLGPAAATAGCLLDDVDEDVDDDDLDDSKDAASSPGVPGGPPGQEQIGHPPGHPGAHSNNGFWLAAVTAAHSMEHGDSAYMGGQPTPAAMADFMTALPHPHGAGGMTDMQCPSGMSPQAPGGYAPMGEPHGGVTVPEYPWMKEKKTTRKNSQQGEEIFTLEGACLGTGTTPHRWKACMETSAHCPKHRALFPHFRQHLQMSPTLKDVSSSNGTS